MTDLEEKPRRRRHKPSLEDSWIGQNGPTLILLALCGTLLWAPFPLGSNRDWFFGLLAILVGVSLLSWTALLAIGAAKTSAYTKSLWPAAAAFSVALIFAAAQIVDLTQIDAWLGTALARDWAHPIWQLGGEALGQEMPAYIAVNPAKVLPSVLKVLLYAAVFYVAFELGRREEYAKWVLWTIAIAGGLYAAIGFAQIMGRFDLGGWIAGDPQPEDFRRLRSNFANPNHFATFAGIALTASLALSFSALTKGLDMSPGRALQSTLRTALGPALPSLVLTGFLAGAIAMSGSRAGAAAALAGCIAVCLLLRPWGGSGKSRSGQSAVWASNVLIAIVVLGGIVASAPLLMRLNIAGVATENRSIMSETAIEAAAAAPYTGNGYGAFVDYYPLYAQNRIRELIDKAHNDYAETLGDLGFAGGAAMIFAPLYLAWMCFAGAIRRKKGKLYSAAAAGAAVVCGLHAYFDFSLHIPAVGLALFALMGVGAAQGWSEKTETHDPRTT